MDRDSENFMKESIAFKQIEKRNTPITEIQCAGTKGEKKRANNFTMLNTYTGKMVIFLSKYQLNTTY